MHTMRDYACLMIYKLLQEFGVLTGGKAGRSRTTQRTTLCTISKLITSYLSLLAHIHQTDDDH